jgi:GT2 family glycosyltransferase
MNEMGGFDEQFAYGLYEDTDLVQRVVKRYGKDKIVINPEVFVAHGGPGGSSVTVRQEPWRFAYYAWVNSLKYARRWGYRALLGRLAYGMVSQTTGRGTVSDQLPKKIYI